MRVPYVDLGGQWLSIKERALPKISEVLQSGLYLEHPIIGDLEERIANFLSVKYVTTVNSGTDALIFTLYALGISRGDQVITVPNSFIASVAAIEHVGAQAVFVDVGDDHLINIDAIESAITPRTRAIMPVHLEGKMVDMISINRIAQKYNLVVIEDAAQAFGSRFSGHNPGNLSDAACFSFHPLKNLNAAGDGGLVATNNSDIFEKITRLKNHGQKIRNDSDQFGFVSRLDSIQAAILHIKMDDLSSVINQRREFADQYDLNLAKTGVGTPIVRKDLFHTYHLYVVEVENREHIQETLKNEGIETKIHYPKLIPEQQAYISKYPNIKWDLPNASKQRNRILSLPIHQNLSATQIDFVSDKLREIV